LGKSQISVMSAILEKEPEPLGAVRPLTPPALDHVVQRALAKDPEERWQSASDIKAELKWIAASATEAKEIRSTHQQSRGLVWSLAATLALIGLVAIAAYWRSSTTPQPVWKSQLMPPPQTSFDVATFGGGNMAISHDGRQLAFVGQGPKSSQLWVQSLDQPVARPLPGTDEASYPFWSPDGRYIAFFANGRLKRIAAAGGPTETICDAANARGGSWGRDGSIIFAPSAAAGLQIIRSFGMKPEPLTILDRSKQELGHRWPSFLPDGKHFLVTERKFRISETYIVLGSTSSKERKQLLAVNSNAQYVEPGYILFVRDGTLMAQRFDATRLRLSGEPVPVAEAVAYEPGWSKGFFLLLTPAC
jgi:hypothetical protein